MVDTTLTFRNRWVLAVDGGARRTPGWAAALIAAATVAVGLFGGGAAYRNLPPLGAGYALLVVDRLLQDVCVLGPFVLVAWGMLHLVERRPGALGGSAPVAGLATAAGAVLFLLALGLAALAGAVAPGEAKQALALRLLGVVVGAGLVLVQAGAEEYFFRGWLQPVLAARWGPLFGLVTAALLFAAAHALMRPLSPLAFLNDTLAGLAFGLFALRAGGLPAALGAHWGWNWAEQSLAGATPNPGVDPTGALFDVDLRGASIFSGGADEMNGSLCATAALVVMTAAALFLNKGLPASPER